MSRHVEATPEQVFAVLADGWTYSNWVTGTSHVRAVEAAWPAAGSKVFHATGAWPVVIRDETVVDEVAPDRRLVLTARGRPFGQARVAIVLTPEGSGARIDLTETPVAGLGKRLDNPVMEAVLTRRNVETLARLAAIAERSTTPARGAVEPRAGV